MQPFSALAPQIIAIKESVPLTEKNKMPSQPYFLRRVFHFGVFFSSINIFLIYNIEFNPNSAIEKKEYFSILISNCVAVEKNKR